MAKTADGDDDPDRIGIRGFHPEIPLARLDQDNRVFLRDPPPAAGGTTYVGNPLVRIVTVALVDAADLGGLRLCNGIHNIHLCALRQA